MENLSINTGLSEYQIAIFTHRIHYLKDHFSKHPKDHHSKRGLMMLIGKRRRMLRYLKRTALSRYEMVIKSLKLRHIK
jgi:small subunit ribosomal protein S15